MMAVSGVVDVIRWYRKGTPVTARVNGERIDRVDCACRTGVRWKSL
jgi:hypothetical protein